MSSKIAPAPSWKMRTDQQVGKVVFILRMHFQKLAEAEVVRIVGINQFSNPLRAVVVFVTPGRQTCCRCIAFVNRRNNRVGG